MTSPTHLGPFGNLAPPRAAESERLTTLREFMLYFLGYRKLEYLWVAGTPEKYRMRWSSVTPPACAGSWRQVTSFEAFCLDAVTTERQGCGLSGTNFGRSLKYAAICVNYLSNCAKLEL